MIKQKTIILSLFILGFASCSPKYVVFKKTDQEISDENLVGLLHSKAQATIIIELPGQAIVGAGDKPADNSSSSISYSEALSIIERQFRNSNGKVKYNVLDRTAINDNANADVIIKIVDIGLEAFETNTLYKRNGKKKVYSECGGWEKKWFGGRLSLDITSGKGQRAVLATYTFIENPCPELRGCPVKPHRGCELELLSYKNNDAQIGSQNSAQREFIKHKIKYIIRQMEH